MNKRRTVSVLPFYLSLSIIFYGCGSASSSSESAGSNSAKPVFNYANLVKSTQNTTGGFMDVNGDSYQDKVVTAPYANTSKGSVCIYYGSSSGTFPSVPSVVLEGDNAGDSFGYTFTSLGDLNADGKEDFAIAAMTAEGNAPVSGVVYVYSGGNPPTRVATLNGEDAMDRFGWAMASGDIDGNGKNDLVVSALYNTNNSAFQGGALYIYLAASDGTIPATPTKAIYDASTASAGLGYSIAVGDINGDSKADIIAGESYKALAWYGAADISGMSFSSPGIKINGVANSAAAGKLGSGFGKAVAVVGDINGDGYNDFAIGNPNRGWYNVSDHKGAVYIFKGSNSLPSVLYVPENTTDGAIDPANESYPYLITKISGESIQDRFGSFILPLGDVVGTGGKPDFAIGAVWANAYSPVAGRAYLFSGEKALSASSLSAFDAELAYSGYFSGGYLGTYCSVAMVGQDAVMMTGAPGTATMTKLSDGHSISGTSTNSTGGGGGHH